MQYQFRFVLEVIGYDVAAKGHLTLGYGLYPDDDPELRKARWRMGLNLQARGVDYGGGVQYHTLVHSKRILF